EAIVEEAFGRRVEGGVDGDDVAHGDEGVGVGMEGELEFVFLLGGKSVLVRVAEIPVEGAEASEDGQAYPAGGDGPDRHPLEVVGALDAVGDVPTTAASPVV